MLSLYGFQPFPSPVMGIHWPVRSLWPEITPLHSQRALLLRNLQEMKTHLKELEKHQHKVFEEITRNLAAENIHPVSCIVDKEGGGFALTLDTKDYAPEELCVKQVGRKLQVSGNTETKQDDGKGTYSYRSQQFRREFELPEGVNPEAVTCGLIDGKLHIEAPKNQGSGEDPERTVPIESAQTVKTPQTHTPTTQNSGTETQKSTEEKQQRGDCVHALLIPGPLKPLFHPESLDS